MCTVATLTRIFKTSEPESKCSVVQGSRLIAAESAVRVLMSRGDTESTSSFGLDTLFRTAAGRNTVFSAGVVTWRCVQMSSGSRTPPL